MKQKHGGGNKKSAALQERLEILCARYGTVTILSDDSGYRVLCAGGPGDHDYNGSQHEQLDKAVKELTPDI